MMKRSISEGLNYGNPFLIGDTWTIMSELSGMMEITSCSESQQSDVVIHFLNVT
jgi:hypothetical protein